MRTVEYFNKCRRSVGVSLQNLKTTALLIMATFDSWEGELRCLYLAIYLHRPWLLRPGAPLAKHAGGVLFLRYFHGLIFIAVQIILGLRVLRRKAPDSGALAGPFA